jgi:hypothetical protein
MTSRSSTATVAGMWFLISDVSGIAGLAVGPDDASSRTTP